MLTKNKIKPLFQHNIHNASYKDVKTPYLIITFTEITVKFIKKINMLLKRLKSSMICMQSETLAICAYHGGFLLSNNKKEVINRIE